MTPALIEDWISTLGLASASSTSPFVLIESLAEVRVVVAIALSRCRCQERNMTLANRYLEKRFWPDFNRRFMVEACEAVEAFVPVLNADLDNILCVQVGRYVGKDNCVSYHGHPLQIPQDRTRRSYAKTTVPIHEYEDGRCAIFHGPRCLTHYDELGNQIIEKKKVAA
ncbi:MAG: hypothetical protein AAF513_14930 [Pseudomonadota bacterium]